GRSEARTQEARVPQKAKRTWATEDAASGRSSAPWTAQSMFRQTLLTTRERTQERYDRRAARGLRVRRGCGRAGVRAAVAAPPGRLSGRPCPPSRPGRCAAG